jgi:thiamine biosynthesis lipoprotein
MLEVGAPMNLTTPHANAGKRWSRRSVLKVLAAVAVLPLGAVALRSVSGAPGVQTWRGESLGGPVSFTLWHPDDAFAHATIARMRTEVERLDAVFSLLRPDSEIVRLNREGRLDRASPDLVAVVAAAQRAADVSSGAFDPTVQPLWRLYESHFRARPDDTAGPSGAEIEAARALVGYDAVVVEGRRLGFARQGMAMTLNGIAQGYITDRITDLLREEGYDHAIVELGETRAVGDDPDGAPWPIGLVDPTDPTHVNRTVGIANQALSVSGGYGMRFGHSADHHIFNPATGRCPNSLLDVTVIAPRAVDADALSTAIFVAGEAAAPRLLAAYPGARAMYTRA